MSVHRPHTHTCTHKASVAAASQCLPQSSRGPWKLDKSGFSLYFTPIPEARHLEVSGNKVLKAIREKAHSSGGYKVGKGLLGFSEWPQSWPDTVNRTLGSLG